MARSSAGSCGRSTINSASFRTSGSRSRGPLRRRRPRRRGRFPRGPRPSWLPPVGCGSEDSTTLQTHCDGYGVHRSLATIADPSGDDPRTMRSGIGLSRRAKEAAPVPTTNRRLDAGMFHVLRRGARRSCSKHESESAWACPRVSPRRRAGCPSDRTWGRVGWWRHESRKDLPHIALRHIYAPGTRHAYLPVRVGTAKEDTVRTKARVMWALTAAAAVGVAPLQAQSGLFVGVGFGLGYGHGEAYGIYSSTSDGWGLGYGGHRQYRFSRDTCWDRYWDSYWDPWSGWYSDCVVYGPYRHSSFRASSWRSRWSGWYGPSTSFAYWQDPYASPWGPYWSHDPWNSYWNGYGDGYWDGRRFDDYYGGRVRTVYAAGGSRGVSVVRPSPFALGGTGYKENPRGTSVRTATRRPATTAVAAPATAPARVGSPASAGARPEGRPAVNRMPPQATPTRAASPEARPSDRARSGERPATTAPRSSGVGSQARTPGAEREAPAVGRQPAVDRGTQRGAANPAREPASVRTPAAGRPSDRVAPTRTAPNRTPAATTAPSGQGRREKASPARTPSTRVEPSRAPSARAEPSRTPAARAAPSRAPSTRSEPAREPSARSQPSRAPSAGSTPRAAPRSEPQAAPRSAPSAAPRSAPSAAPRPTRSSDSPSRRPPS